MNDAKTQATIIPTVVSIVSILLVLDGLLALAGCLVYKDGAVSRLYGAAGAVIIILTGVSIFVNHSAALAFSFVCTVLLTADAVFDFIQFPGFQLSAHTFLEATRAVFNIGLYWVGFLSYKRWRSTYSGSSS